MDVAGIGRGTQAADGGKKQAVGSRQLFADMLARRENIQDMLELHGLNEDDLKREDTLTLWGTGGKTRWLDWQADMSANEYLAAVLEIAYEDAPAEDEEEDGSGGKVAEVYRE